MTFTRRLTSARKKGSSSLHRVTLEILGSSFDCHIAFSEWEIKRELLGRHELFSRVRFRFREGLQGPPQGCRSLRICRLNAATTMSVSLLRTFLYWSSSPHFLHTQPPELSQQLGILA